MFNPTQVPPPVFDGSAWFGKACLWAAGVVLVCFPYYGFWTAVPLAVALYINLKYVNRLEERDLKALEEFYEPSR